VPSILPPLACPVRGCGVPLAPVGRAWNCANGHHFDVARSGYINLLQPQDRRSARPGDAEAAIDARARLLASGVGRGLLTRLAAVAARLSPAGDPVIVDLGCGSGDTLAALSAGQSCGIGIDLATAAVTRAARTWPALTWVVANADRRLPLLDSSVDVVTSVHARRNPAECSRVLKPGGWLLVAVPAPDDLVELREAILGKRVDRQRADAVVDEHAALFALESTIEQRERIALSVPQLGDLLTGTYRGARQAAYASRVLLEPMTVTMASVILAFRSRRP
jgi:23S rRNA (guanine745-N1)-methyltransferase